MSVVFLANCDGAEVAPEELASPTVEVAATSDSLHAPTATPLPTKTPTAEPTDTPIPLSDLDLGALVDSVALPSHLTPTVFSTTDVTDFWRGSDQVSLGENFYSLSFHNENSGNTGGGISVYLYDTSDTAAENIAYVHEFYQTLIQPREYDLVGDSGMQAAAPPFKYRTFLTCSALVNIRMADASDDQIDAYAQRIEAVINGAACGG